MVSSRDTGLKGRRKKWADVLAGDAKAQSFREGLAHARNLGFGTRRKTVS
jgi:hypothetical protein